MRNGARRGTARERELGGPAARGTRGFGVGVLTFYNPAATALAHLFYIAIWAIATGLLEIVDAIRLRKEIEGEFWLGLAGLASIVFGMLIAARPKAGALAVL